MSCFLADSFLRYVLSMCCIVPTSSRFSSHFACLFVCLFVLRPFYKPVFGVIQCNVCMCIYNMSPSSMLKLDLRLESTEASGDIADSNGSPPIGDRGSSNRKPSSPLFPWRSSPPRSPSPDIPSEKLGIPSEKSSDGAKS